MTSGLADNTTKPSILVPTTSRVTVIKVDEKVVDLSR